MNKLSIAQCQTLQVWLNADFWAHTYLLQINMMQKKKLDIDIKQQICDYQCDVIYPVNMNGLQEYVQLSQNKNMQNEKVIR